MILVNPYLNGVNSHSWCQSTTYWSSLPKL